MRPKFIAVVLAVTIAALVSSDPAGADQLQYQYKFPCYFPDACYLTGQAHGQGNALDFDPLGWPWLGQIPAMAEGTVTFVGTTQDSCTYPNQGLGLHAIVTDIHGRSTTYAHLSALAVTGGMPRLQGDLIGTEGNTGYSINCEPHLHWEPGSLPQYINGLSVSSLSAVTNYGSSNSNSIIGMYSTAGATLRAEYIDRGGWDTVGWTHKHTTGANTLNMFPYWSWGWAQDFRVQPDGNGDEFQTLHVARWDQSDAYTVDTVFWEKWALGGLTTNANVEPRRQISTPLEDRHSRVPARRGSAYGSSSSTSGTCG